MVGNPPISPATSAHTNGGCVAMDAPYAFPPVRDFQEQYLTVLAEHTDGACPRDNARYLQAAGAGDRRVSAIVPPLWRVPELTFTPFLLTNPTGGAPSDGPAADERLPSASDIARMFEPGATGAGAEFYRTPILSAFGLIFQLIRHPYIQVSSSRLPRARRSTTNPPNGARATDLRKDGRRIVIVGVIDHGIPFANARFRDSTGKTRVEFFWNQAGLPQGGDKLTVPFGTEFTRSRIDRLVERYPDEDLLYRKVGMLGLQTKARNSAFDGHASHGSIVLDILAGQSARELEDGLADEIRVIAVQLPNAMAWDTSGFGKDMLILSAFHYICNRAKRDGGRLPRAQ